MPGRPAGRTRQRREARPDDGREDRAAPCGGNAFHIEQGQPAGRIEKTSPREGTAGFTQKRDDSVQASPASFPVGIREPEAFGRQNALEVESGAPGRSFLDRFEEILVVLERFLFDTGFVRAIPAAGTVFGFIDANAAVFSASRAQKVSKRLRPGKCPRNPGA